LQTLNLQEARRRISDIDDVFKNTCGWIFDPELQFTDWLQGYIKEPIYWIQGKPGSGKSTAMKFAMTHGRTKELLLENNSTPWIIAGYFFHDRGSTIQKSVKGFLGELLYQLLEQRRDLFPLIIPVSSRPAIKGDGSLLISQIWHVKDIKDALVLIASKVEVDLNLCLFVDALDEHDGNHNDRLSVLSNLRMLTDNEHFRLRLCVAARPEGISDSRSNHVLASPFKTRRDQT
jgi:hypothetical protein